MASTPQSLLACVTLTSQFCPDKNLLYMTFEELNCKVRFINNHIENKHEYDNFITINF